eukprot:Phypoly_transcript_13840.p1 GENE.Phypoly_transcript_13840~~Phypoly_transcript_13840.p1  ORF type:complete len:262 (+),score=31.17 Phypoly_transcript_13840:149-934(+)
MSNKSIISTSLVIGGIIAAAAVGFVYLKRRQSNTMSNVHVVLLGDSIFDNQVYVSNDYNKSVPGVLERRLKAINKDWKITHNAVDGAVMKSIDSQLASIPASTTHLFMSIIGNDCLHALAGLQVGGKWREISAIDHPAILPILTRLVTQYEQTIVKVKKLGHPLTVCNLYAPRFDETKPPTRGLYAPRFDNPQMNAFCRFAVQELNTRLLTIATKYNVNMIDIFSLFTDYDDYANAIEPGEKGSEKIAKAIEDVLLTQVKQ